MQTSIYQPIAAPYTNSNHSSLLSKFIIWSAAQERNRFGWVGGILSLHGCVITPITLFAVVMSGNNIGLFITALVAMQLALVTNLAAMPTKVTIPVFFLTILIDLCVIISCAFLGFSFV